MRHRSYHQTKPCFSSLLHQLPSKPSTMKKDRQIWRFCSRLHFYSQWGLGCFLSTNLTYLNLSKFYTDDWRHLCNKLQEETYLCAFPSWELSSVEEFWFSMVSMAAHCCVHSSSSLASPCSSVFVNFFPQRNTCWQGWITAWINFSRDFGMKPPGSSGVGI